MSIRNIRKAFILLFVDIVIIIGIFVLQFRTDSSIIEKIGNLQFTLAKAEDSSLENKLQATYNGMSFFCDDQHPVEIIFKNKKVKTPVSLVSYEKLNESSYSFKFTDDVTLIFTLSSSESDDTLSIKTVHPSNVTDVYLPYNLGYSLKVAKDEGNHLIVNGKKNSWEVNAGSLSENFIGFNKSSSMAMISSYKEVKKFSFDSIAALAIADASVYETNITSFKNNLISSFKAVASDSANTEQSIVSYIAAMAERGEYTKAIEDIPSAFKQSKNRTYLSAPYFNTLENMNKNLEQNVSDNYAQIERCAAGNLLDVFAIRNISFYMTIYPDSSVVEKLLSGCASQDMMKATLTQVTGLLQVYTELSSLKPEFAALLNPALAVCVERIGNACSLNSNFITISENDTFLSVNQAVEIGITLIRYGTATMDDVLLKSGYAIVNSYLSESGSFDIRTLSNIYPVIAYNNTYYPHFKIIDNSEGNLVWAWTCAKDIKYVHEDAKNVSFTVDFPENYTHYVIFKGIPVFHTIHIYNMVFRTDPRFETYNSSGYVYKREHGTLLLKSRHKSRLETVSLELGEKNIPKPVVIEENEDDFEDETESESEITADNNQTISEVSEQN